MTLKGTSESDSLRLYLCVCFSVAQSCHVQLFAILRTAARQASLSFTISWSLLQLMSIELMMPPNHLIHCQLLLLLPSIHPVSGSFPMNQLFAAGGQSIGASASVLPMNIQGSFPLGVTGLIFLLSKGLSRILCVFTHKCTLMRSLIGL